MLVCGSSAEASTAKATLDLLSASIDRFSAKAISYLNGPFSEDAQIFGAFCTRVTLESACAALVGRLDSFRMLYLAEFQSQEAFEYGRPAKSGFRWSGDVFTDERPVTALWSVDQDPAKVSRALFSPHLEAIYWRPAFNAAIDYVDAIEAEGFTDLRRLEATSFIPFTKGKCARLYSTLSKGVHWDFFAESIVMDEGTLKDTIRDCVTLLSTVAFVSHFVPTAFGRLGRAEAVDAYLSFRGAIQ